jgi:predicted amidohydrolase YtcJ
MAARLTTLVVVAIVAVTLIAGLIVGAQRDDNDGPVDLIVHNARLYTANDQGTMAEAVAIRGNQILRVGSNREITRLKRPQTRMIDAKGAAVLPGFNDAHLDFVDGGAALDRIDLLDAVAPEDIERRIRDWADANPDRPWVVGRGWHRDDFAEGPPTRQMLDRLVPDRPAQLLSADGRTAWVNSEALRLARIGRGTASPARGAIVHDARTGEPTGVLQGTAVSLVDRLVPMPTASERDRALRAAIAEAHRYGVTSVQDVTGSLQELAAYAEAQRTGDLQIRIYSGLPVVSDLPDADLDRLVTATAKYPDDPLLKAGALNLTLDDGPVTTGATAETASIRATAETLQFEADALNRLVRRLDARGWQIRTDAASDLAVRMTLNAYEHAVRSNPDRAGERRHRIENVEAAAGDDLPRLASFGGVVSIRPFGASMRPFGERFVGDRAERAEGAGRPATASLANRVVTARGRLAFGSGWPAAPLNPMLGLSAVVRPPVGDEGEDSARVSLKTAIDAYTSGAAWASFDEQRKGTIAAGMLADIVVLSEDIFKSRPSDLAAARVEITIFDGKVVYRRGQRSTN